ncbi:Mss4-like protein [Kalaharituber pfeilii]|nr:Mss4-like protein [Kalaharituber pfeilii]
MQSAGIPSRLYTSTRRKVANLLYPSLFGKRTSSFRRAGGVRTLISKRGLGLNSAAGTPHFLPKRVHPKRSIRATGGFLSSVFAGLFSTQRNTENDMSFPMSKTDTEWRAVLSPEQFRVLRQQGTEAPHSGEYASHYPSAGVYSCAGCKTPLYKASTKFKSGCGWPAFFENIPGKVLRRVDNSFGVKRTEIICAEWYNTPTDERHCVNSISLKFVEDESKA